MKLSVVIPCWDDAEALRETLKAFGSLWGIDEVVVADASEAAECREIAAASFARVVRCPAPSRGGQMNAGAAVATGDLLVFHHADSILTQGHVEALRSLKDRPEVVGGAFHRKFSDRHWWLRWLERVNRVLSTHGGTLYGDQTLFVRRAPFARMGGFAEIPLMEDVEFSKRLRRLGPVVVLDPPMASSVRRFERLGAWRTSVQNGAALLLFRFGVSPRWLHAWYYRADRVPVCEKTLPVAGERL